MILLAGTPGRADEVSEAREHYKKGTKAFELGAFQEAVAEYAAAYRLRDDPALLYNLAQSNRLANHPLEALRLYRMFLLKTPNASNREEVESKIAELRKLVEQQQTTANAPLDARQVPPPSGPSVTPTPTPEPKAPALAAAAAKDTARTGKTKQVAGIALASGGVAILVGGIVCGVLATQASDALTKLDQNHQKFDYDRQQAGLTEQTVSGVLLGVGGAAVVTGTVLFLVGRHEQKAARTLSFVPGAGRGFAGAFVSGSF